MPLAARARRQVEPELRLALTEDCELRRPAAQPHPE